MPQVQLIYVTKINIKVTYRDLCVSLENPLLVSHIFDFRKDKQFVERCWKDVRVGDFVKVFCNEIVSVDLLLLHTSDPNGVCHIETANLDGETNLKQRRVVSGFCNSVSL